MATYKVICGDKAGEFGTASGPAKRLNSGSLVGPFGRTVTFADGGSIWIATAHLAQVSA